MQIFVGIGMLLLYLIGRRLLPVLLRLVRTDAVELWRIRQQERRQQGRTDQP
jgi:hypothetical protein